MEEKVFAAARDVPDTIKLVYIRDKEDSRSRLHVSQKVAGNIKKHCKWNDTERGYICTSSDPYFEIIDMMLDSIADERGLKE